MLSLSEAPRAAGGPQRAYASGDATEWSCQRRAAVAQNIDVQQQCCSSGGHCQDSSVTNARNMIKTETRDIR